MFKLAAFARAGLRYLRIGAVVAVGTEVDAMDRHRRWHTNLIALHLGPMALSGL